MLKHQTSEHKRTVKFKRMRELINITRQHKVNDDPMLSKEFAEQWADALESGNYEQGRNSLYSSEDDGLYCCIGVACVELGVHEENIADEGMPVALYKQNTEAQDVDGYSIRKEIRIPSALQSSLDGNDLVSIGDALALCNDAGWSFKSIALFIRRYLV